MSYIFQGIS